MHRVLIYPFPDILVSVLHVMPLYHNYQFQQVDHYHIAATPILWMVREVNAMAQIQMVE
jgi:hypothetical protein